jgi:hypothetical protein
MLAGDIAAADFRLAQQNFCYGLTNFMQQKDNRSAVIPMLYTVSHGTSKHSFRQYFPDKSYRIALEYK